MVLQHITGGLAAHGVFSTIFHRVMAFSMGAGVIPANSAPFFLASPVGERVQSFLDDNVVEHHDANVEVIMMQY